MRENKLIMNGDNEYKKIEELLREMRGSKFMLVCGNSFLSSEAGKYIVSLNMPHVIFKGFSPNPKYEEIIRGVELYRAEKCDCIIAAGGGSAMDTAKGIKLYSQMSEGVDYINQPYVNSTVPLIAIPTTAGTGSESTKFCVMYYNGEKQSVTHDCLVPEVAILLPSILGSLPVYQKKCTMLDALCQAIESYWSVNSTDESKKLAEQAIMLIWENYRDYINGISPSANEKIMLGSNLAGQAINISATTAPHAMSYKLTTIYGLPHGHSVAISLPKVWKYMLYNSEKLNDARGEKYVLDVFASIAGLLGCSSVEEAVLSFEKMLAELEIGNPSAKNDRNTELTVLVNSVNVERLGNNPIMLDRQALNSLYEEILK